MIPFKWIKLDATNQAKQVTTMTRLFLRKISLYNYLFDYYNEYVKLYNERVQIEIIEERLRDAEREFNEERLRTIEEHDEDEGETDNEDMITNKDLCPVIKSILKVHKIDILFLELMVDTIPPKKQSNTVKCHK